MVRLPERGGEGVQVWVGELLIGGKLDESPEGLGAVGQGGRRVQGPQPGDRLAIVEAARPVYWQCWAVAAAAGADGRASGGVGPAVDELVGEDGNAVVGVADGGIEQCFGMRSLGHLGISSCCMARRRVPPIVRPVGWTRSRWVAGGSVVASS